MKMNKIYGVAFKDNGKVYNFWGDIEAKINEKVIVETEKGQQLGKITKISEIYDVDTTMLKRILRVATQKDYDEYLSSLAISAKALEKARIIAQELDLEMHIIDASFTFDRKQLLLNFLANERIDFRELVKRLAAIYHTRIELRQIGVRDKAKEIGGIGPCGRKLCCTQGINAADSISINMAKNQNIALNPNKINGCCGRLLCCLAYEDDEYTLCKKDLPEVGNFMMSEYGKGVVESVNILKSEYTIKVDDNLYTIAVPSKRS